jgi:hypothetical protein
VSKRIVGEVILVLCLLPLAAAAQTPFLWGTLRWRSGDPANAVQVRLVRGGAVQATALSNPAGRYAFFNQPGTPSEYTLQVVKNGQVAQQVRVPQVPVGGQVPDIVVE